MEKMLTPDYIFEASWEVCNKVGGIYTVLSSRAKVLNTEFKNKLFFIGPDVWKNTPSPYFTQNNTLLKDWRKHLQQEEGLSIKIGTWQVPGKPVAILVDYRPLFERKDDIYGKFWEIFGVDSLHAYGDYDDSSLFGYAAGVVINNFYEYFKLDKQKVVAHFNEWQTGFGEMFLKMYNPKIATIFTTHATAIGRSIAEHEKPLYSHLHNFNGKQMAYELNMESKHSVEYTAAQNADCFTTVSDVTAAECEQLHERKCDVVLPNGFESNFVPRTMQYRILRRDARQKMTEVVRLLLNEEIDPDNTIFVATSGRYEYKNKGVNVFIDAVNKLNTRTDLPKTVVAFILVPGYIMGPRIDLQQKMNEPFSRAKIEPSFCTHKLYYPDQDAITLHLRSIQNLNAPEGKVKFVFAPCFLDGKDGIFNMSYYDMLLGFDATIFPSYYEPWGYTPLESAAFSIPTITTDLSGFGQWVKDFSETLGIENGVAVVHRTDNSYHETVAEIEQELYKFCKLKPIELKQIKKKAQKISQEALWTKFIEHYKEAYHVALSKKSKK